jgi:hypothetical protein
LRDVDTTARSRVVPRGGPSDLHRAQSDVRHVTRAMAGTASSTTVQLSSGGKPALRPSGVGQARPISVGGRPQNSQGARGGARRRDASSSSYSDSDSGSYGSSEYSGSNSDDSEESISDVEDTTGKSAPAGKVVRTQNRNVW